ncbi:MAG: hypothetical protein KGJ19_03100, partial [Betaproteobacteria bacterium]|nr:hypothetical protein [Betaproteobacteria bacterium]
ALDIKRWLLAHEGAAITPSPLMGEGWGEGDSVDPPPLDETTDGTTSHPTKLQKPQQVAGYSAKAGIQSNKSAGFRVKPGMTKSK